MLHPTRGLGVLSPGELLDIIRAIWHELAGTRSALHGVRRAGPCDLRCVVAGVDLAGPARPADPTAARLRISGGCECRDLLVDAIVEADRFLLAHPRLINPPGAVRVHVRTRTAADYTRNRRVQMGAQARTDRIRTSARGRALPDDLHRAVFEHLVAEAGSLAPLDSDDQLHLRLAELVATEFGGSPATHRDRVTAAVRAIEAVCRAGARIIAEAGSDELITWWERYIERPLGRRTRLTTIPLDHDAGAPIPDPRAIDPGERFDEFAGDELGEVVLRFVVDVARHALTAAAGPTDERRLDDLLGRALRAATQELAGRAALPPELVADFVADPARFRDAVDQLRLLTAG